VLPTASLMYDLQSSSERRRVHTQLTRNEPLNVLGCQNLRSHVLQVPLGEAVLLRSNHAASANPPYRRGGILSRRCLVVSEKRGNPWLATLLRCTVFAIVPTEKRGFLSLEQLTGNLPDQVNSNPKVGTTEEVFSSGANVVSLKQEPGRVDLVVLAALPDDPKELTGLPSLGAFDDQCQEFSDLASKIFKGFQENDVNVRRIAFGSEAIIPVEDHQSGYILLDKYLPFVEVDPASSDFLFGINRRRSSNAVQHIQVNRLSRWSVRRLLSKLTSEVEITFYAVHLLLDVNSVRDYEKALAGDECGRLFDEFIEFTFEILEQGDCK
jgi:hypothetical protein